MCESRFCKTSLLSAACRVQKPRHVPVRRLRSTPHPAGWGDIGTWLVVVTTTLASPMEGVRPY